jgi:uncharacterized membrane protein YhdT
MHAIGYLVLCIAVAWLARKCGRSAVIWFLISCVFDPILATIALIVVESA